MGSDSTAQSRGLGGGGVLGGDLVDGSDLNSEIQLIRFAKPRTDFEPLFIFH